MTDYKEGSSAEKYFEIVNDPSLMEDPLFDTIDFEQLKWCVIEEIRDEICELRQIVMNMTNGEDFTFNIEKGDKLDEARD